MVLNDAAGEGVNLQRGAHLMVNYYLPWNPVRIEQRFGRVHQIAQTELCHLWNLCEDVILICRRKFVEYLNPKSGCKTSCLAECSSVVEQLAISSSASTFAVACQDGTIRLWDVGAILQRGGTIGDYVARQARTVGRAPAVRGGSAGFRNWPSKCCRLQRGFFKVGGVPYRLYHFEIR